MDRNTFLVTLKGAPLSVLLALWVFGAMGRRGLSIRTGWDMEVVGRSLERLEVFGLVERVDYRRWRLGSGFVQLPFPLPESGENRLSAITTTAAANSSRDLAAVAVNRSESLENRLSDDAGHVCALLVAAGVGAGSGKMREILAKKLSYAYVAGHVEKWRGETGVGVGLLIKRLLDGDPMPRDRRELNRFVCRRCSVHPCQCDDVDEEE